VKVADFFRRTVGSEVLDYVVDPFISTVYCGDPSKMSLRYGSMMTGVEL
jgi:oxygen-dependent protoporphyrinogen oxidase